MKPSNVPYEFDTHVVYIQKKYKPPMLLSNTTLPKSSLYKKEASDAYISF